MRKYIRVSIFLFILFSNINAGNIPPLNLVQIPTAGILPSKNYSVSVTLFPNGGLLFNLSVGILNFTSIGIGYGGNNIIGEGDIKMNPHADFSFKLRVLNESFNAPGILLGFNSQGSGPYCEERYYYKSMGAYIVGSKNYYVFYGDLSFHSGVNYSFTETNDKDSPDVFFGLLKGFDAFSIKFDYRLGLDDKGCESCAKGRGYMNLGLSFNPSKNTEIELLINDILKNKSEFGFRREIRLSFIDSF